MAMASAGKAAEAGGHRSGPGRKTGKEEGSGCVGAESLNPCSINPFRFPSPSGNSAQTLNWRARIKEQSLGGGVAQKKYRLGGLRANFIIRRSMNRCNDPLCCHFRIIKRVEEEWEGTDHKQNGNTIIPIKLISCLDHRPKKCLVIRGVSLFLRQKPWVVLSGSWV